MSAIDNPLHDQEVGSADATQDTTRIDDVRIGAVRPLISPALLQDELPVPPAVQLLVEQTRVEIADILHERDDRLVMIVGPCSIHDHDQAIDYAHKLKAAADAYKDDLLIIMRVYFEKPRTTVGWKGLINDPYMDGSFKINDGLRTARELLMNINELGLPAGTEYLDVISPQYIADLVSWGAIGARTTESQVHRELASGLSCPVGFKNGTDGNVKIAVDAIKAASQPHHFLSVTKGGHSAIVSTAGNEDCHIILRGGKAPNYDAASVQEACDAISKSGLAARLMIDASHANSSKKHENQIPVCEDIGRQMAAGDNRIVGVMVESHINAGRQDHVQGTPVSDLAYGQSVTDACIGWDDSVKVLETLADAVRKRRLVPGSGN